MAKQDFINALARCSNKSVVLGAGTSIACLDLMEQTQCFFPDAHLDPEKMASLAQAGHTVIGLDVVMPLFSVCHETEALGCNIDWGKPDQMPHCKDFIYTDPQDITIPDDLLEKPSCQVPLKAINIVKKRLGNSAAVCGKVFGPWTLGYHLFGIENFLIDTVTNPTKVKKIIEVLSDVTVAFANAQIEAGADCILLGDHATADLCSPDAYKQFLQKTHSMLAQKIHAPVILHICGNTKDRIEMIAQTGIRCFHWDTKSGSPASMRQLAGSTMSLMGGVSNSLLLTGTPDEIVKQAQQAADNGIDIVGPECAIPLNTPLANLKAIAGIRKERP
jgi:[methyl-Co(III) methanol-specific corrinoid protein]:coenzyme M methyltransferase